MSSEAVGWCWIGCVIFATFLGCLKERPGAGLVLGILFGPIGCILAAFLPPKGESAFVVGFIAVMIFFGEVSLGLAALKAARNDHAWFLREQAARDAEMRRIEAGSARAAGAYARSERVATSYEPPRFTPSYLPRPALPQPRATPTAAEVNRAILEKYGSRR